MLPDPIPIDIEAIKWASFFVIRGEHTVLVSINLSNMRKQ